MEFLKEKVHSVNSCPHAKVSKLSKERLDTTAELAERIKNTFPPPFVNKPHDGPVETPEGNDALAKGMWANANRQPAPVDSGSSGRWGPGFPDMKEISNELGGPEGFFLVFGYQAMRMFTNPRMHVLFDTRYEDTRQSAFEHGRRVASTLLDETHNTSYFQNLGRGFSGSFAVIDTHKRAKQCPMRPKAQQVSLPLNHPRGSHRFTVKQRDSWVGHAMQGAEACGASDEFVKKLGLWLAMAVSAYAPFFDEVSGKLDWMEETPYGETEEEPVPDEAQKKSNSLQLQYWW